MPTIRPGRPHDHEALRKIQRRALAEPWPALLETALEGPPRIFVIECEDLLGYAIYLGHDEVAYVPELAVRPDRQGEGHGSSLVSFLCERLADGGFVELRLTVRVVDEQARGFYDSQGFEVIDRLEGHFESGDGLLLARKLG